MAICTYDRMYETLNCGVPWHSNTIGDINTKPSQLWAVHYQAVSGPAPGVLGALKKHVPGHLQMLPLRIAVGYRTKNLHGGWGISRQWSDGASVLWSEGSYIYDNIHVHIVIHSYTQTKTFFSIKKRLLHGVCGFQGSGHREVSHPGADHAVGPHHL